MRALPALCLLAALLPAPAEASHLFVHRTLTERALSALDWDEDDIEAVVRSNQAADLARLPGPARLAAALVFPVGSQMDRVASLAATAPFNPRHAAGFHFNALFTYDEVARRWNDLGSWVDASCAALRSGTYGPRSREAELALAGLVAHAVQDFYEHANWVRLLSAHAPPGSDASAYPLWEELVGEDAGGWRARHPQFPRDEALETLRRSNLAVSPDESDGGLQTGRIRGPVPPGIDPWKHRHLASPEREIAHGLAVRATIRWMRRIEGGLGRAD
jgi:hypothetical protein